MASLTTSVPFAWATSVDPKNCITYKKKKLVYLHVASKGEKHKKEKMSKK